MVLNFPRQIEWLKIHFRMQTEIWDMKSGEIKLIDLTLREGSYSAGTGAFIVDANYCKKN